MRIPKTVTEAKAKANKENAQKSTGPKSERGKFFASQNATTYGLNARDILLPGESEEEFNQLLGELIIDGAPVGFREYQRVERLVWHEWRRRRGRRAENGEITMRLADHQPAAEMAASTHTPQYNQAVRALNQLEQIEEQVRSRGRVSADNLDLIRKMPYFEMVRYFLQVVELVEKTESGEDHLSSPVMPDAESANGRPTEATKAARAAGKLEFDCSLLLGALRVMKDAIGLEKLYHVQCLGRRSEGKRNACLLPQEADLNRLIRWENHLSRQIERDENALERMQRLRRGEKVPPPNARNG